LFGALQAKYKDKGNEIAEDQFAQVLFYYLTL
jgi:hypothetical protein